MGLRGRKMSNGAGKGSRYRPVNKELYDKNYERIFGKKEEKKAPEGNTIHEVLSDSEVRDELGLPNGPEECDLNSVREDGCPLDEAQNLCKGCVIGRKKNEDDAIRN